MRFKTLTEENFILFAMKNYDNPSCDSVEEFNSDLNRIKYLKRLLRKCETGEEIKERLILNHLIIFFNVFGVSDLSVHAGMVFFSMLYAPVSMVTSIISSIISRRNEFSADRYSYETTNNKYALISMLKGLAANNLSHLTPHPFKVFLSYSHPPVLERIKAIEEL